MKRWKAQIDCEGISFQRKDYGEFNKWIIGEDSVKGSSELVVIVVSGKAEVGPSVCRIQC